MRAGAQRVTSAIEATLAPGERVATMGAGWAAPLRGRVPMLFLGRRQYWFALTDRRLLAFPRRRGGPRPEDLTLGKRYSFFALEKVHRHRPLFQLLIRGANDSRLVLEFRPRQRALAAELVARLTRALPPGRLESAVSGAMAPAASTGGAPETAPALDAPEPVEVARPAEPAEPTDATTPDLLAGLTDLGTHDDGPWADLPGPAERAPAGDRTSEAGEERDATAFWDAG